MDVWPFIRKEWRGWKSASAPLPMSKSRDLQRVFFSAAFDAELDAQGRILLLRQPAARTQDWSKETVVIGAPL